MGDLMAASHTSRSQHYDAGLIQFGRENAADQQWLAGVVKPAGELSALERDRMHGLMARYFIDVGRAQFESDLAEKEWIIILKDALGVIQGFSTLMRLKAVIGGQPLVAFFSGDTIIAREYWGATTLPRLWSRHVFSLAATIPDARVYWFLISSGYRTYRFLPTFFREFYPNHERPTPSTVKLLIDTFARRKFGDQYDAERGIVRFARSTPLQSGVAEITEPRLKDAHVSFFAAANPGHGRGDELACLAELTASNLTPAGQRMLALSPQL